MWTIPSSHRSSINGAFCVQYLGVRYDPEDFRRDLLSLLQE
jgi:hypothetical protein